VGIVLGALGTHVLYAQPSGIKRTLLMHKELAGIEGREVYMVLNEVPGGVAAGRHFHDGHEVGYVLEGAGVLEVDGEPPLPYKAGDSYHIEATRKHDAKNTGTAPLKVLAVYLIEKGKPLTVPAP
jgi:quercetin dioxygenase-like cupin family protein